MKTLTTQIETTKKLIAANAVRIAKSKAFLASVAVAVLIFVVIACPAIVHNVINDIVNQH